ncbi:unnamed protein product, partial [Linum tenue]
MHTFMWKEAPNSIIIHMCRIESQSSFLNTASCLS